VLAQSANSLKLSIPKVGCSVCAAAGHAIDKAINTMKSRRRIHHSRANGTDSL
jgi:hypothetical protein